MAQRKAGRPPKDDPGVELRFHIPTQLNQCLAALVKLGIDGGSRQDIARLMISEGVRERIRDGYLDIPTSE